jgi:hypothetical protein
MKISRNEEKKSNKQRKNTTGLEEKRFATEMRVHG